MNKPRSFAERRAIIARVEARVAQGESMKDVCLAEGTTEGTLKGWKRKFKVLEGLERLKEEEANSQREVSDRRKKEDRY